MIKQHIPNALTSLNLAAGMAGIIFVLDGQIEYGTYMIFAAAIFDFLDGFAARILKVSSEIGKQLDSLADMVTFGVLPALMLFTMIEFNSDNQFIPYTAFLIGIFSALRLAKFNIDTRQSDRFIGVPTPANALLISTLPFLAETSPFFGSLLSNPFVLVGIGIVMSFLLVAELPLIALKFKDFSFNNNLFRYLVLVFSLISLIIFGIAGIPFAIILYIALSFIQASITRNA